MKPRLFISYRHSDSAADARQIGNALKKKFGKHNVFIDVSGVGDGQDINEITHALKKTDIVIAVIGRNWVGKPWTAPDSALSKSEIW
ncbi:MAG: toll/interleukin-1 receptor domain-containing protein, partial [Candidatus Competibacteraceae bacterium]|nr:toll/interleukin-1 receptor domain-containing protein [Candidatus Competibacteraceae bacterium]